MTLADAELAELERAARVLGSDEFLRHVQHVENRRAYLKAATTDAILSLITEVRQRRAESERSTALEAVVGRLATRRPYAPNPYRDCFYCYGYAGEHEPDCLWLAARRLMGAGGGD